MFAVLLSIDIDTNDRKRCTVSPTCSFFCFKCMKKSVCVHFIICSGSIGRTVTKTTPWWQKHRLYFPLCVWKSRHAPTNLSCVQSEIGKLSVIRFLVLCAREPSFCCSSILCCYCANDSLEWILFGVTVRAASDINTITERSNRISIGFEVKEYSIGV